MVNEIYFEEEKSFEHYPEMPPDTKILSWVLKKIREREIRRLRKTSTCPICMWETVKHYYKSTIRGTWKVIETCTNLGDYKAEYIEAKR